MADVVEAFKSKKCFRFAGPASDASIDNAEQKLGLSFAEDYRKYLSAYGQAVYYGHELTGLGGLPYLDVLTTTIENRKLYPDFPRNCYVLEEVHIDGIVIWQADSGEIILSTPSSNPRVVFRSLLEYVKSD